MACSEPHPPPGSGNGVRADGRSEPEGPTEARASSTVIRGARMHNLRGIDCEIPLGRITAVTGVSGSGKSTLAFDVLYAEGQRRFVECLSAYARQFLERLERPDADAIGYIQPPIAIKQRVSIRNARSTVGTITELTDLLRLLYVHAGQMHCAACGGRVMTTGTDEAVAAVHDLPDGTPLAVVAPLATRPEAATLRRLEDDGYQRLLAGGRILELGDAAALAGPAGSGGEIGVVVDRLLAGRARRNRITEAVQAAWRLGGGRCRIHVLAGQEGGPASLALDAATPPIELREGTSCQSCGAPAAPPTPALFSWNSPIGACPECQGFGRVTTVDRAKVVPDPRRNLRNDAVVPFGVPSARHWYRRMLKAARAAGIPTDVPFGDLAPAHQEWVFTGDEDFPGVEGYFQRLDQKRYKMHVRIFIARFRGYALCPRCQGARLRPEALQVTVLGRTIHDIHETPIADLGPLFAEFDPARLARAGVSTLVEEIRARLRYLMHVGVGYLTPGRAARTLSGGETQRIRLAAALGSALTDTLYILDEPSVGLHATDSQRVVEVLQELAAAGNTVVVVEHDPGIIAGADHLIILGPGGGIQGGRVVYEGQAEAFLRANPGYFTAWAGAAAGGPLAPDTESSGPVPPGPAMAGRPRRGRRPSGTAGIPRAVTARAGRAGSRLTNPWDAAAVSRWLEDQAAPFAAGRGRRVPGGASGAAATGGSPAPVQGPRLEVTGAREHNLRIDKLTIPLSRLVAITGISGSGKSTLLDEIVYRNWLRRKGRPVEDVGAAEAIEGFDGIEEIHLVGQELLGRSSRSNPISFVDAYGEIRKLLAGTLAARQRRLAPGAFSFNTAGGRCETCKGMGTQMLEMYFLPDVEVPCEGCGGRRFRPEVLEVAWHDRRIDEILQMSVDEAAAFFQGQTLIVDRLAPLREVGLGYILLGQSTTTLSGGEAQRLRLASFLSKGEAAGRHVFLFDEPTTGLHARDIEMLVRAIRRLLARGHGVVVVEHNLDLILASDWVIDLGPGPGADGGRVVFAGTVGELLQHPASLTAHALRARLGGAYVTGSD
jgi:excinuclease ABC subunit A